MAKVFIDGEAGTTGLQIRERLAGMASIDVISIDNDQRKNADARRNMMRLADLTVLCLPDDAAREAVALASELGGDAPKIIDASTAHRIDPAWVYGFPELAPGQAGKIEAATRVANPGCYATGAIALLRPLIEAGLAPPSQSFSINAVSGYTGGGKSMIAGYEAGTAPNFELYGLALNHKHIPEIMKHTGLTQKPVFVPSVGAFPQGMIVCVPLQLSALDTAPRLDAINQLFASYYAEAMTVIYHGNADETAYKAHRLSIDPARDTDKMEIWTFANPEDQQAVLVARLDNLGKGAAGAAVQNLKLMLSLT
jgi:N-acetyl-gamma-glutamyl-phosphate reductase